MFFNEGWVALRRAAELPARGRHRGVHATCDHVETAFSFRTRILDYLWPALPIVATGGDTFAELIDREGLGRTVAAEDVDALEAALEEMLFDEGAVALARENVARVAQQFTWTRSLAPLVSFCRSPRRAADLADGQPLPGHLFRAPRPGLRDDLALAKRYLAEGGVREVGSRAAGRVRRLAREVRGG